MVIPVKTGIEKNWMKSLDSCLRKNDAYKIGMFKVDLKSTVC